jgi:hypothetical protein
MKKIVKSRLVIKGGHKPKDKARIERMLKRINPELEKRGIKPIDPPDEGGIIECVDGQVRRLDKMPDDLY